MPQGSLPCPENCHVTFVTLKCDSSKKRRRGRKSPSKEVTHITAEFEVETKIEETSGERGSLTGAEGHRTAGRAGGPVAGCPPEPWLLEVEASQAARVLCQALKTAACIPGWERRPMGCESSRVQEPTVTAPRPHFTSPHPC